MTKVSRFKLDSEKLSLIFNNFWSAIALLDDKRQIKDFFQSLLTHTEMEMLSKRIQIAKMLLNGNSYEQIKHKVKVTDSTIARINNLLAIDNNGLEPVVKKLKKIEEDLEKERMSTVPNLKKRYPTYFLPEIVLETVIKKSKHIIKKKSAKKII